MAPKPLSARLTDFVRLLAGAIFLLNGFNWFFKIITPYPSSSDFIDFLPPPDVVGAMIENGVLFQLGKCVEILVGLALLTNRFVPLALVLAMPLSLPIFIVDVFFIAHARGQVMGWGTLIINLYLLAAHLGHYHGLLAAKGEPTAQARAQGSAVPDPLAARLAKAMEPLMTAFGALAAIMALAMLAWLAVMIVQYALDPQPLSAIAPLKPRIG